MIDKLDRVEMTKDRRQLVKNQLSNLYTLRRELRNMIDPGQCVELLYVELLGENRLSYIQRILGRHSKLTKYTELERLNTWRLNHGKS